MNESINHPDRESFDWRSIDAHLKTVIEPLTGTPRIRQFTIGNSNLTYLLSYDNRDLVLRRPPIGTKAKSAHSMAREYRILKALKPVYQTVPEALYYSADETLMGSEFYVMEKVDGAVVAREFPDEWALSADDRRQFAFRFFDRLIALHQLDYRELGLEDFGRPEGYISRQIAGWNHRFENALTDDVSAFEDVKEWLVTNQPEVESAHSILHGDYRIDNIIVNEKRPFTIEAVLDWEICALGDPLMDLGNALAYWVQADDPPYLTAIKLQPSADKGMPTRTEIVDYYRQQTGRGPVDFTFYLTYGYFRNAVILQQIYYRYYHGQTSDKRFQAFGQLANALGQHCQRLIRGSFAPE